MPWHRRRPEQPRAHWIILLLALTALLAALVVDGFAQSGGGGTLRPGQFGVGGYGPSVGGPILRTVDGRLVAGRLPDREVALTFDDGPDPVWTPRILDALARWKIKATFFVVGARVDEHPELVRRILAEGHELGLHSFNHSELADQPAWEQHLELAFAHDAVARATGRDVRLFRPPYSGTPASLDARSTQVIADAGRRGYVTVLADLDTRDWVRPGQAAIAGAAAPPGDAGAIILLHDGGGDRSQTIVSLETLLPTLNRRGFGAVTVSAGAGLPPAGVASGPARARGWAMATAQDVSGRVSDVLFVLLLGATGLALTRMAIQAFCAWRHTKRRRVVTRELYRPPVSVIVPAHNEAANILATVESLLDTGYPDLEIFVVDDGSTDGTADLVDHLAGVRVLRQPNAGKAAALRAGIAAARHDLLVLIDGDTVVEAETIELLVQPFQDYHIGAVAGNAKVANRSGLLGRWQHLEYVIAFNLDRRVFEVAECMPTVPGALGGFRRRALLDAGGLSSATLAEDTDLTMAICRAGWRVVYEDSACAWTEAPGTWRGLWRQRYRWCYGTMQAMWKHKAAFAERGAGGKLGRRGLSYLLLFQILQPILAPLVDVYLLYTLVFHPVTWVVVLWLGLHAAQFAVAAYAFRLDRESAGPLWTLLLQQVVYRQLIYLVVIQSAVTAALGAKLKWNQQARTGQAAALTSEDGVAATVRSQILRQQQRRSHRDPRWARVCVWFGVVLMLLSGSALVAGRTLLDRYEGAVNQADLLGATAGASADGSRNYLLLGVDWRKGAEGLIRADTIMIMHVPRTLDRAYLFSLPRDTLVDIPAEPATGFPGARDRINAAFAYGAGSAQDRARGGRLIARVAQKLTGVAGFDGAALIDFYGFMEVVNAMEGVDLCVDTETRSIASGVVYKKGCQRMDPASALDYVRQRKTISTGDYARQRHQQQFIKAIVTEAMAKDVLTDPVRLDKIIRAAGSSLTVTVGSAGLPGTMFELRHISPEKITLIRTPGRTVWDANRQYVGESLDPTAFAMFDALRAGGIDAFLAAHRELLNPDA